MVDMEIIKSYIILMSIWYYVTCIYLKMYLFKLFYMIYLFQVVKLKIWMIIIVYHVNFGMYVFMR